MSNRTGRSMVFRALVVSLVFTAMPSTRVSGEGSTGKPTKVITLTTIKPPAGSNQYTITEKETGRVLASHLSDRELELMFPEVANRLKRRKVEGETKLSSSPLPRDANSESGSGMASTNGKPASIDGHVETSIIEPPPEPQKPTPGIHGLDDAPLPATAATPDRPEADVPTTERPRVSTPASGAGPLTVMARVYGLAEQFEWTETVDDKLFCRETGPLFGVGAEMGLRMSDVSWVEGRGELFAGEVDYDGGLMDGRGGSIPYKSTTLHVGLKVDGDLAFRLTNSRGSYLKPYAGLGVRTWRRTLDTALGDDYIGTYGYVETWMTVYAITGCGAGVSLRGGGEVFARVEARLPVLNEETVDLRNAGGPSDLGLKPGRSTSWYSEVGLNVMPLTASLFVETLEFAESPLDDTYHLGFQPESRATMVGVKFGVGSYR